MKLRIFVLSLKTGLSCMAMISWSLSMTVLPQPVHMIFSSIQNSHLLIFFFIWPSATHLLPAWLLWVT